MATINRNEPCPCGSGAKYKKCCWSKDSQLPTGAQGPDSEVLVASEGVSPERLDRASGYFAAKDRDRGRGPADDMADFARPLLDAAKDLASAQNAFSLGAMFWNMAILDEPRREEMLNALVSKAHKTEEDAKAFRQLASEMMERHRTMFPELHRRR